MPELEPLIGDPGKLGQEAAQQFSIVDPLFVAELEGGVLDPMRPYLATSWTISEDGMLATVTLREGVPVQSAAGVSQDFGELTAEDIVWSLNRANAFTNPDSTAHAAKLTAMFGEARVVDKYTFEVDMQSPVFFGLPVSEWGINATRPAHYSKAAFDQMGEAWILERPVSTGPFVLKEWTANDSGTVVAVDDHWKQTAFIREFTVIQVPEAPSAAAMLESGQIDGAELDFSLVPGLLERGFEFSYTGPERFATGPLWFPGNLWEEKHAISGQPLERWTTPSYQQDYPWIGNPWGDQVPYVDADNPLGMNDMEQARLVRWAIAYAIDRDAIIKQIFGGMGAPVYFEGMGPAFPGWDPDRTVTRASVNAFLEEMAWTDAKTYNVDTPLPDEAWPWKIPYDPARAEELLDMAGFPRGANGIRFHMKMNAHNCELGPVCIEVSDVVGTMLQQIGIDTEQLREDYGAVISPRLRKREQFWPLIHNGDVETNIAWPIGFPCKASDSSVNQPGWGMALESVVTARCRLDILKEKDKARRETIDIGTRDWYYYWMPNTGVVSNPRGIVINPDKIAEWGGRPRLGNPNWGHIDMLEPAE